MNNSMLVKMTMLAIALVTTSVYAEGTQGGAQPTSAQAASTVVSKKEMKKNRKHRRERKNSGSTNSVAPVSSPAAK